MPCSLNREYEILPGSPEADCGSAVEHQCSQQQAWIAKLFTGSTTPCSQPALQFLRHTLGRHARSAACTAAAAATAGSGGNTNRPASHGNLWWQPCRVKCAVMAHGRTGSAWKTCAAQHSTHKHTSAQHFLYNIHGLKGF